MRRLGSGQPARRSGHEENNDVRQCNDGRSRFVGPRRSAGRSTVGRDRQSRRAEGGSRLSGIQGRNSVLNDANETIGKIDDLLVTRDGKEPYVVLSIGGFLGMGTTYGS